MFIIRFRKFIFLITSLYIGAAVVALVLWGLRFSIEFTGGSLLEVSFPEGRPSIEVIHASVDAVVDGGFLVNPVGTSSVTIKTPYITDEERVAIIENIGKHGAAVEEKFNSIGPVVGEELKQKAFVALGLVAITVVFFIAFAFRKVSEPVSSWVYGIVAIIALAHDVFVPIGVFSVLGRFSGIEIDALFVTALLTIWGYSVSDTIVVFDRIREHLRLNKEKGKKEEFAQVVGESLEKTYARSLHTSFTTLLALVALYFFGGAATRYFALALIVGIIAGAYSSIFLAPPLLVVWNNWRSQKKRV